MGYVVSRGGTFGAEHRTFENEGGRRVVVIRRVLGSSWTYTPVYESEVRRLRSMFESEARAEAEAWLVHVEK